MQNNAKTLTFDLSKTKKSMHFIYEKQQMFRSRTLDYGTICQSSEMSKFGVYII